MTLTSLPLPENGLCTEPQTLEFEKIVTFIGGNGSGKSTILKSIFDKKLDGSMYKDLKIVCFSSGQNESYSEGFSKHLNQERKDRNALNLDCFYYDKPWSKLVIFLATISDHDGFVRTFLRQNQYLEEDEFDQDITTKFTLKCKVDESYTKIVRDARNDEAEGDLEVVTNKAYHQTLQNFINSIIDEGYDFEDPLASTLVTLTQALLNTVSFERDAENPFAEKVMFFTQAADNNYFLIKESFGLTFKKGDKEISLEGLSDGEYQILFLYSLIDLFDSESTLFLFDEADSHLHYKNIDNLWKVIRSVTGKFALTSHLIDSISQSGIENVRVVEKGVIKDSLKLKYLSSRLQDLSEINNAQLKSLSLFESIVFIDDESDWEIFKLLVVKKLGDIARENSKSKLDEVDQYIRTIKVFLSKILVIKQESGYEKKSQEFGGAKRKRLENFVSFINGHSHKTKNVFLICDRDALEIASIGTKTCPLLVQGDNGVRKFNQNKLTSHLLSWRRREIKHYLLSSTALSDQLSDINEDFDLGPKSMLRIGSSGDYDTNNEFNDKLASISSDKVKEVINYHTYDSKGFSKERTEEYINKIPESEISEDIVSMYNYLVANHA